MGTYGDPITQSIPAVGSSGTQYATDIDLFLTEVKTRLQAKVPLTSLAAGTLDLNNNPITNAQYALLYPQTAAPTSPFSSLQNFGGNLYWVNPSGAVQITSAGALNIAGVFGITGDYGGVNPAQFRFVDVDQEYYAYDDFAGGAYARIWAKNFDLAAASTGAVRVRISATGVGSSYTLGLPTTLPASILPVVMDTAGALSTSGTLANLVTLTTSADRKHSDSWTGIVPLVPSTQYQSCAQDTAGDIFTVKSSANPWAFISMPHSTWGLRLGDRVKTMGCTFTAMGVGSYVVKLRKNVGLSITTVDTWALAGVPGGGTFTRTVAVPIAIVSGEYYFVEVDGVNTNDVLAEFHIGYDHP